MTTPSDAYEPPRAPGGTPGGQGRRFFDGVRSSGVQRPDQGRWVAGVCAGLARRWGMSPMLVRALFVLFGLMTGVGLALYGVLWLLLPHPDGRIHAEQVLRGTVTAGFVGGVLAVLADGPFGGGWGYGHGPWHHGPGLLPLALLALGAWWLVRRQQRTGNRRS